MTSDQPVNAMQGTFSCAKPECTKFFQNYLNLESHIIFGKHKKNSKSALDDIKNKWK